MYVVFRCNAIAHFVNYTIAQTYLSYALRNQESHLTCFTVTLPSLWRVQNQNPRACTSTSTFWYLNEGTQDGHQVAQSRNPKKFWAPCPPAHYTPLHSYSFRDRPEKGFYQKGSMIGPR